MAEEGKLGALYYDVDARTDKLNSEIKNTDKRMQKLDKNVSKNFSNMGTAARGFGLALKALPVIALVVGFSKVVRAGVKMSAQMEQNQIAFKSMLGSGKEAKELVEDLVRFSAETPFELEPIVDGGKKLLAFGVTAEEIIPTLTKIGDVASGLSVPLGDLTEIYGKAKVQQTLFSEDLNQLAGRGVPIFTELSKIMGVGAGEIKKMASEGKIGFGQLEKVFDNMTKQGGQFFNLMAAQSQSLSGLFSTLKVNLALAFKGIGDDLSPALKELIIAFSGSTGAGSFFADALAIIGKVLQKIVLGLALFITDLGRMVTNTKLAAKQMKLFWAEMDSNKSSDAQMKLHNLRVEVANLEGASKSAANKVKDLTDKLFFGFQDTKDEAENLRKKIDEVAKEGDKSGGKIGPPKKTADGWKEAANQVNLYANALKSLTSGDIASKLTSFSKAFTADFVKANELEKAGDMQAAAGARRVGIAKNIGGQLVAVAAQTAQMINEVQARQAQEELERLNERSELLGQFSEHIRNQQMIALGTAEETESDKNKRELKELKDQFKVVTNVKKKQAIGEQIKEKETRKKELQVEEDFNTRQIILKQFMQFQSEKIRSQEAARAKKFAMFSTAINTASASMAAFGSVMNSIPAYPANLIIAGITAGIVTAFGGISMGMIGAANYAEGGVADTPSIFGEAGRELAVPLTGARGQAAISELSQGMLNEMESRERESLEAQIIDDNAVEGGSGDGVGDVYLDGSKVGKWIFNGTKNATIRIDQRGIVSK